MNPDRPTPRRATLILSLLVALVATRFAGVAHSHPHNWIDVRVEVRFDTTGRISGLHQRWLFDDYYSATIIEGIQSDADGAPSGQALAALRDIMLGNLRAQRYFTLVEQGARRSDFAPPTEGALTLRNHRLALSFLLPLAAPLDPRGEAVRYRLFDPTYYIEMVHAEADDAITLQAAPAGCRHHLTEPDPDPRMIARAAALDIGASGGDGLGIHFAQQVTIRCPADS